jgi:hypothetical protein
MAGTSPAMTESIGRTAFGPSLIVFPRRSNRFAAPQTPGSKIAADFLLMFAPDSAGLKEAKGVWPKKLTIA